MPLKPRVAVILVQIKQMTYKVFRVSFKGAGEGILFCLEKLKNFDV